MIEPNELALRSVFQSVLGVDDAELVDAASPDTIPTWDSLTHVSLMLAIEAECGVVFEPTELMELRTFGDIRKRLLGGGAQP